MGVELYIANKFNAKDISGLIQFTRYISDPITLRYSTLGRRVSSPSSRGQKMVFFASSDRTTRGVLKG